MDSFDVVPAEVANLQRTKAHCASGLDGISAWMLGSFADSLSPSIASMFNLSILGRLTTMWKVSHVVPIPKKSSKHDVSSYRPISLLPIISKCLEGHIKKLLLGNLSSNNLLSNDQFGFHANQSTVIPLLLAIHQWHKILENGKCCCLCVFQP